MRRWLTQWWAMLLWRLMPENYIRASRVRLKPGESFIRQAGAFCWLEAGLESELELARREVSVQTVAALLVKNGAIDYVETPEPNGGKRILARVCVLISKNAVKYCEDHAI